MDENGADKVVKRKRPRSSTVAFAKEITREKDYYKTGNDERRTKSGLYFTRKLPLSLKISLFNQDVRLKGDMEPGYADHLRKISTISNDSTDGGTCLCSKEDDTNSLDEESDNVSFTAEDVIHIENSMRMSQLRAEKQVSFFAEKLLHDAIQRDDICELCDLLSKHEELDLEKPNSFDITPLHRAAIDGGYRCLNFLLSRNVNVQLRDMYGWTALHDAVYRGHNRCAAALIMAGSHVEAETNDFIKPIEMAPDDEMLLLVGRAMTSPGYVYDQERETLV